MRWTLLGSFVVVVLLLHFLACGSLAQRRGSTTKPVAAVSQCPQYHLVLREYEIVLNASIREQLARQADDGNDDDAPLRPRRGMRGPPPDRGAERRRREKSLTDAMEQRVQERVQALRRSRAKQADEKSGCGGSNSLLCLVLEHWSSILAWGGGVTALLVLAELVLASAFPVTASRATEELVDAALGRRGIQSSAARSPASARNSASPAAPHLDLAPEAPLGDFVTALQRSVSPAPTHSDAVAPSSATASASSPPIRDESQPQQNRAVTLTPERREELGLLMDLLLRMHGGRHLAELRLLKWSMTLYAVAWALYTFVEVPSLVKAAVTGFGAVTLFLPGGFSTVLATAVNSMMSVMNIVWTSLCVPCIRSAWATSDKARERWGVAREVLRGDLQRDVAPMAAQLQQRLDAGQEQQQRRGRHLTA